MLEKSKYNIPDLIYNLTKLKERENDLNSKKLHSRREELYASQLLNNELAEVIRKANEENQSRHDNLRQDIDDNNEQFKLVQQKSNRQIIVLNIINNRPDADIFLKKRNLPSIRDVFVNYIENGDISTIFNAIRHDPQHLKYTLSPQICRMALRIIDSYFASISVIELIDDRQRTTRFDQTRNIYAKISLFADYGRLKTNHTVNELSNALEEDLNHFISGRYSAHDFKSLFLARLHSQDDKLCQRSDKEKLMVLMANIAIAFLSIGIATVVQLFYSRITTGEYRFFFSKTAAEEKAFIIEKELTATL